MILLPSSLRHLLKLSRQCRHHRASLHRGFSRIPPIDEQSVRKDGPKNSKQQGDNLKENNSGCTKSGVRVCIVGGGITPLYTAVLLKQYQIIKNINLVDTKGSMSAIKSMTDTFHRETGPGVNYFERRNIKQAFKEVRGV